MIEAIKAQVRKNKKLLSFYYTARFVLAAFFSNLLHPSRFILYMKVLPYTMVEYERVANVYEVAELVERNKLNGAFVECGVWKGGTTGVMAYVASKAKSGRKVWLFDSFEGLPEPTAQDGEVAKTYAAGKDSGQLSAIGKCVGPLEDVRRLFFSVLQINPENVYFGKGWFQNVLPKEKQNVGPIALLRLDADWYESTKCALENLYDNVVPGGYILIDDYGHWEGCKKAVDEFLVKRGINVNLQKVDYAGVYFQKQ